jgi:hypothetical protein
VLFKGFRASDSLLTSSKSRDGIRGGPSTDAVVLTIVASSQIVPLCFSCIVQLHTGLSRDVSIMTQTGVRWFS